MKYDFSGWVTKNDLRCSDGRTIIHNAFKDDDGKTVPLVWNHQHNDPNNVLGKVTLENRDNGVYGYGVFNDTDSGNSAKMLVQHGDVTSLSIYANKLKQSGGNVLHGNIREVSLVLAGANPGAYIDSIMMHGDYNDEDAIIYTGEDISLYHADDGEKNKTSENKKDLKELENMVDKKNKKEDEVEEFDLEKIYDGMDDAQKEAVHMIVNTLVERFKNGEPIDDDEEMEDTTVKHNIFDNEYEEDTLTHSEMSTILGDAKRYGSVKESFLAHADEYGIENIDYLFPDAKTITDPGFISRKMDWVATVMNGVRRSPFSRVKSVYADITKDEARAKGYTKGNKKIDEVITLLKRTTDPQSVVKKQKLDRDDVLDITDFDVVTWIKSEMRIMLDEEIARAILIGDGRSTAAEDKISEDHIRPIAMDDDLYTIHVSVEKGSSDDETTKNAIKSIIKARKEYKGSGNPVLYTTEDFLTDCLLLTDSMGRDLYDSVDKLATKLRVSDIITVEVMEGQTGKNGGELVGVIVNLTDYNVGADRGGAIGMFDDFDIDYNQQKYLIETRCSGALIRPYSAIAVEIPSDSSSDSDEADG